MLVWNNEMFSQHAFVKAQPVGERHGIANILAGKCIFPGLNHGANVHGVRHANVYFHFSSSGEEINPCFFEKSRFLLRKLAFVRMHDFPLLWYAESSNRNAGEGPTRSARVFSGVLS